jgi:hypothetical protein
MNAAISVRSCYFPRVTQPLRRILIRGEVIHIQEDFNGDPNSTRNNRKSSVS